MSEFENSNNESTDKYDALINEATPEKTLEELRDEKLREALNELQDVEWSYRYLTPVEASVPFIGFVEHTTSAISNKVEARKKVITAISDWVSDQSEFDDQTKELLEILEEHLGLGIATSEVIDVTIGAKVYITRKVWEDADTVVNDVVENLNITISEGWGDTSVDDYEITSIEKEW